MIAVNPKTAQSRAGLSGRPGRNPSPKHQILEKLQCLTRMPLQTRLAVSLAPWGTIPMCGQISPHKTSSENSGALTNFGPDPPCTPSGRASATCGDCGNTVQRKSRLQKTPYTCSQCREKPSASARTWHSIRLCTPGQSPMHVRTVAKPSAGSPT